MVLALPQQSRRHELVRRAGSNQQPLGVFEQDRRLIRMRAGAESALTSPLRATRAATLQIRPRSGTRHSLLGSTGPLYKLPSVIAPVGQLRAQAWSRVHS